MKRTVKIIGIVLLCLVAIVIVFAKVKRITPLSWGHKEVNQPMFSSEAINGYDPVAYTTENKAVAGNEKISHTWNDADWYFSTEENKNLFAANPEKYVPQFGGYCAFAVSKGFTANIDPNAFEVINGKVYLFADEKVKSDWMGNQVENLKTAEANWELGL